MISGKSANACKLGDSSAGFSRIARQMFSGTGQMSHKSNRVAAAAEEMSANMTSVAAASEQASANRNMVASAADGMTIRINTRPPCFAQRMTIHLNLKAGRNPFDFIKPPIDILVADVVNGIEKSR